MSPAADLESDLGTSKSTSGLLRELQSADGTRCWPLEWRTKRQGSTASSTRESEIISAATALKSEAESEAPPMSELLESALGRPVLHRCLGGNARYIQATAIGYGKERG